MLGSRHDGKPGDYLSEVEWEGEGRVTRGGGGGGEATTGREEAGPEVQARVIRLDVEMG